jgi:hypothetical protein
MLNSIGILIGGTNKLGSYLKKLILTFQARVAIDSGSFEGYDCMESLLKQNNKSILDKASLVITPNAYKEGKIYSVIPTDGSGDLSVVRATTATRVNGAGLIEETPYNLVSYSELFTNAGWVKQSATVTLESGTSPLNTPIFKMLATGGFSQIYQSNRATVGLTYSTNALVKKGNCRYIFFRAADISYYDFNTNTFFGTNASKMSAQILSDGWVLITISQYVSTQTELNIYQSNTTNPYAAVSGDFTFVSYYQTNLGSPKPYFKTTDRANVPRLDYTNATCPSILVEPQRTNLLQRSEEFDNAYWTKAGSTISANAINSPNGTLTADRMVDNISTGGHFVEKVITTSAGVNTFSVFCKKDNNRYIELCAAWNISDSARFIFDFDTKTITSFGAIGPTITYVGSNITELQDGWFRLSLTFSVVSLTNIYYIFALSNSPNVGTSNLVSYLGDGTKGVFIWGAQLEVGSNATSYIPTTTSIVTRNADVISKTGISSLIGQTEGVIYYNLTLLDKQDDILFVNLYSDNCIYLLINSAGVINPVIRASGVSYSISGINVTSFPADLKLAIKYKSGDSSFFINGVKVGSNSSNFSFNAGLSSLNLVFNPVVWNFKQKKIKGVLLFKTALTDAECIQLTTI